MTRFCRHCSTEFTTSEWSKQFYCADCRQCRRIERAAAYQQQVAMNGEDIGCKFCPTPEEIEAAKAEIQAGWSDAERASRAKWAQGGEATTVHRYAKL